MVKKVLVVQEAAGSVSGAANCQKWVDLLIGHLSEVGQACQMMPTLKDAAVQLASGTADAVFLVAGSMQDRAEALKSRCPDTLIVLFTGDLFASSQKIAIFNKAGYEGPETLRVLLGLSRPVS